MARKYARDNRGRFASGGGGATARGGRLKTASGNKRATQTMKAAGAGGVIKGRTARTVAGEKVMAKMGKRAPAAKRISAARPGGTVAKPKGLKPGAIKGKAKGTAPKVDLTDAGFTRRLRRAQRNLSDAQKAVRDRGMSEYDYKGKARLGRLQSAVDSLKFARTTVRRNTVTNIKTTDKALIENYNRQLAATKRKAASTPSGGRSTTAPKLTPSQKAAATRQRNRAARDEENRRRWEQARRYG